MYGKILRCKLVLLGKFHEMRLYFFNGKMYNEASNKPEFTQTIRGYRKSYE